MKVARGPQRIAAAAGAAVLLLTTACSGEQGAGDDGKLAVATTIGIISDFIQRVGGDRVDVTTIVPPNGDPHSYEPSPGDARKVTGADVVFSNGLLLEEPSITKLIDGNLRDGTPKVALAEQVEKHGGSLIPLEEDLGLDVLWLGLAVEGGPSDGEIRVTATGLDGPGDFFVYLTDTFGSPKRYVDSTDGFGDGDVIALPPAAHTHVNWAFTEPGTYRLALSARYHPLKGDPRDIATSTVTFAIGGAEASGTALDTGHADVAVDVDGGGFHIRTDDTPRIATDQATLVAGDAAKTTVSDDKRFGFLGAPGSDVWLLPQAVLGKHVHGEIDPHLWQDVANARAYVQTIQETLVAADPEGRSTYTDNATRYLGELDEVRQHVATRLATIPAENRRLITTHDAFGYLAEANGMEVLGFVVPNPGQEPSAAQVSELNRTIAEFRVPAVFVEPNLAARADVLRRVAEDQGVEVCVLYGDAFDDQVASYTAMMRHNADELTRCLKGKN